MNIFLALGSTTFMVLAAVVLAISLASVFIFRDKFEDDKDGEKKSYRRKQFFMTKAEHTCYKALVQAVGNDYFVFAQVHLPTILDEKVYGQNWRASRAHVDRKSVDFVLCDKEFISPKLAIELDDWSHDLPDRQERDREVERILAEAGMPLLRITDTQDLARKIKEAIESGHSL